MQANLPTTGFVKVGQLGRLLAALDRYQLWLMLLLAPAFILSRRPVILSGIAGVIVLLVARWLAAGRPLISTRIDWPLAGLLVTTVIGTLVSLSPGQSSSVALGIWYGVILFYTVVAQVRDTATLRAL